MKRAMMNWADKMMMMAYKAVRRYQEAGQQEKDMSPAKKNMLYGQYLKDMDDAL